MIQSDEEFLYTPFFGSTLVDVYRKRDLNKPMDDVP